MTALPQLAPGARTHGQLELICGPMFSGKSEELMRRLRRVGYARKHAILVKPAIDYRRQPFGPMPRLLAMADEVAKLKAVCHSCGEPALYTQRLVGGQPAPFSGETVVIGSLDSYEARCRACYEPG